MKEELIGSCVIIDPNWSGRSGAWWLTDILWTEAAEKLKKHEKKNSAARFRKKSIKKYTQFFMGLEGKEWEQIHETVEWNREADELKPGGSAQAVLWKVHLKFYGSSSSCPEKD